MRSLIKQLYGPEAKQHEVVIREILSRYWVEDKHVSKRCKILTDGVTQTLCIDNVLILIIHPVEISTDGIIRRKYTHLTRNFNKLT